ncbi:MAG: ABC transporter ATP-binding protein [Candidatus Aminicenantes bacterium]|nr:ABC transporter ATP-binding protein [Candidatus Aminicenantes bacterium]
MIRFVDVFKSFRGNSVLRGLNLEIRKGETFVIIGQSGSGKSVLLKHMIGLLHPDKGQIYIDGVNVTELKGEEELYAVRRKFAMLFQGAALFDSMTVAQNVSFGLERYTTFSPGKIKRIVTECLDIVGLRKVENLMPFELSGGMKKRVGLARAIAYNPEIILYDEPSTGIDQIRANAINVLINRLKEEFNVTSVVITHDMDSTFKVADRIAMLYKGTIIESGTPEEIQQSKNQIVQQFIHGYAEGPLENW